MKKKLVAIALMGIIGISFSGCMVDKFAEKYSPDNVQRMLMKSISGDSKDKFKQNFESTYWANVFSEYYDKEDYMFDYTANSIRMIKHLVYFSDNVYLGQAPAYIQQNSSDNEFLKLYKNEIIKRGNSYKIFKGEFNNSLLSLIYGHKIASFDKDKMQYVKTKLIPVVAEFDKSDKLVSIMLNSVKVGAALNKVKNPNVQSEIILEKYFYTGSKLNPINNNVSQVEWNNQLLYASKKESI